MSKRGRPRPAGAQTRTEAQKSANTPSLFALWMQGDDICCPGYTVMSKIPEIQTACLRLAELIGSMTIYLMGNTADGDKRITNELSRAVDIHPNRNMNRAHWMTAIVMNLLLYGRGNSIVVPHTSRGYLESLEPISADRVTLIPLGVSRRDYRVCIDGQEHNPEDLLHFVYNPDPLYLWKGQGVTVTLKSVADNLRQSGQTINAFMSSEWRPPVIVKVTGMDGDMASSEGRQKLIDDFLSRSRPSDPLLIPGEVFDVAQVKPLSLADLAIKDTIELDKKTVASVIGVPPFLLGVGDFKRDEWNSFIQTKVRALAQIIQQELTRGLIISPDWYFAMNIWSLMDYDLGAVSNLLLAGADRGYVCGDEWRDRMHLAPAGLKDYKVLENYIPADMSGQQKKLIQ